MEEGLGCCGNSLRRDAGVAGVVTKSINQHLLLHEQGLLSVWFTDLSLAPETVAVT